MPPTSMDFFQVSFGRCSFGGQLDLVVSWWFRWFPHEKVGYLHALQRSHHPGFVRMVEVEARGVQVVAEDDGPETLPRDLGNIVKGFEVGVHH